MKKNNRFCRARMYLSSLFVLFTISLCVQVVTYLLVASDRLPLAIAQKAICDSNPSGRYRFVGIYDSTWNTLSIKQKELLLDYLHEHADAVYPVEKEDEGAVGVSRIWIDWKLTRGFIWAKADVVSTTIDTDECDMFCIWLFYRWHISASR